MRKILKFCQVQMSYRKEILDSCINFLTFFPSVIAYPMKYSRGGNREALVNIELDSRAMRIFLFNYNNEGSAKPQTILIPSPNLSKGNLSVIILAKNPLERLEPIFFGSDNCILLASKVPEHYSRPEKLRLNIHIVYSCRSMHSRDNKGGMLAPLINHW